MNDQQIVSSLDEMKGDLHISSIFSLLAFLVACVGAAGLHFEFATPKVWLVALHAGVLILWAAGWYMLLIQKLYPSLNPLRIPSTSTSYRQVAFISVALACGFSIPLINLVFESPYVMVMASVLALMAFMVALAEVFPEKSLGRTLFFTFTTVILLASLWGIVPLLAKESFSEAVLTLGVMMVLLLWLLESKDPVYLIPPIWGATVACLVVGLCVLTIYTQTFLGLALAFVLAIILWMGWAEYKTWDREAAESFDQT